MLPNSGPLVARNSASTHQVEIGFLRPANLQKRVSAARLTTYHHSVPATTIQIAASAENFGAKASATSEMGKSTRTTKSHMMLRYCNPGTKKKRAGIKHTPKKRR